MTACCSFRDRQLAGLALQRAGSVTRLGREDATIELHVDRRERPGAAQSVRALCDVWPAAGLGGVDAAEFTQGVDPCDPSMLARQLGPRRSSTALA
jgi:hypothetical protein